MKRALIITSFLIIVGLVLFVKHSAQADPMIYYFNNSINTNPEEIGNYWYDEGFTQPANELPNFAVDRVFVTAGATFDGNATFNDSNNQGIVTGNATFKGTAQNLERVIGNAVFYEDSSENSNLVEGTLTRRYTVGITTNRDFQGEASWTVIADGVTVDVSGAGFGTTTTFVEENGGIFIGGTVMYFNNAVNTSPIELGNYWLDANCTIPAPRLPNFTLDEVSIVLGIAFDETTFNGTIIFNGAATNRGVVTGSATFNDTSQNIRNPSAFVAGGEVQGNATFNNTSINGGIVQGTATFNNGSANNIDGRVDLGAFFNNSSNNEGVVGGNGTFADSATFSEGTVSGNLIFIGDTADFAGRGGWVNGSKTRRYNTPTTTVRNFTTDGPWTIIADGVVVDVSGANYDITTTLSTENDGSFIYAAPVLNSATGGAKLVNLRYNKNLDTASVPSTSDFSITVNGLPVSVSGVSISGAWAILTLSLTNNLASSDIVSVDYTPGANPIRVPPAGSAVALDDQAATVSTSIDMQNNILDLIVVGNYVYGLSGNTIRKINLDTEAITATVNLGTSPQNIVRVGNKLYIPNFSSNNVSVFNLLTDTVSSTIAVGGAPFGAIVVGNKVYVVNGNSNSVSVIDTTSDTVTTTIAVGAQPRSATAVGDKLYVNNYNGQSVSVIDTTTNTVTATISVGPTPSNSSLVGTKLYVPNGSSQIKVIDTTTNTLSTTISPTGGGILRDTAVFGSKLYIADGQNARVIVVNTATDTVSSTINVGAGPTDAHIFENRLYIANNTAGTVSVINPETDTVTDTLTVAAGPRAMAVRGNQLFVACQNGQSIVLVDTQSLGSRLPNLVSFSSSTPNGTYTAGQTIALTATFARALENGSTMTVSLNSGASVTLSTVSGGTLSGTYTIQGMEATPDLSVTAITSATVGDIYNNDRTTYATTSSLASVSAEPLLIGRNLGDVKNIAITPFASATVGTNPEDVSEPITVNNVEYVYVANRGANTVSVIKKSDGTLAETIAVGTEPIGLTTARLGGVMYVYVANSGSNTVSVINTATNTVATSVAVGVRPMYVAENGGKIYVSNSLSNTVSVISAASNTVTGTISVGVEPRGLHTYGSSVYVANFGDANRGGGNSVSVINAVTDTISNTLLMPAGNDGTYDITDSNGNLYVSHYKSNSVAVIDIATGTAEETILVSGGPRSIISHGGSVYVSAFNAGTVWAINPSTNLATAITTVGHSPSGLIASGETLYIGRFQDGALGLLNTVTNTLRTEFPASTSSSSGGGGGGGGFIFNETPRSTGQPNDSGSNSGQSSQNQNSNNQNSSSGSSSTATPDKKLTQRLAGRLLLAVEDYGRVWYVDPVTSLRYEITKAAAMDIFRRLSLGITNADLRRLPVRLRGRLLLAVQDRGKIWYIDASGQRHQITKDNIVDIFRRLALGINDENLDKIPAGDLK